MNDVCIFYGSSIIQFMNSIEIWVILMTMDIDYYLFLKMNSKYLFLIGLNICQIKKAKNRAMEIFY